MVPTDKRAEALALFSGFLTNTDLPASWDKNYYKYK